jgi:ribosome-binding ATPase
VQLVRCFDDDVIIHVEGGPNPIRDIDIINTELLLADLQSVEGMLAHLQKKVPIIPFSIENVNLLLNQGSQN